MEQLVRFLFEKTGYAIPEGAISVEEDGTRIKASLPGPSLDKLMSGDARLVKTFRALLSVAAAVANTRVTLEINEQ